MGFTEDEDLRSIFATIVNALFIIGYIASKKNLVDIISIQALEVLIDEVN